MLLKRIYHQDKLVRDEETGKVTEVLPDAVKAVKIVRAKKIQNFSARMIERASGEGWLSIAGGKITITGVDGSVIYKIIRTPGYYCCHCDKRLDDSGSAAVHIEAVHPKASSPDPSNPIGYRKDNFYACEKE